MEPSTPSLVLRKSKTPLSLPSWRCPSMRVKNWSLFQLTPHSGSLLPLKPLPRLADTPPGPYWVLSTDYTGHSLVYGCTDYGLFHMELSWILSREPTLPKETVAELHGILSSIGVAVDKMLTTVQEEGYCGAMEQ